MNDVINFTTLLLCFLSPVLVAVIIKCQWPDEVKTLTALLVVTIIYTAGRWLDGALTWPLHFDYAIGLAAAFGTQQLCFQFVKRTAPMQTLTAFGQRPPTDEQQRLARYTVTNDPMTQGDR